MAFELALSQLLRKQASALIDHLAGARDGIAADVHKARVASRRLREALPVAVRAAPGACVPGTRGQVRRLTVALGGVREIDVACETFAAQCQQHGWRLPLVRGVQQHLERERRQRGRRLQAQLARVDVARLDIAATTLATGIEAQPTAGWPRVLGARVRQRTDRFAQALEDVGTLYAAERLHRVRIATKKLRYTLELAAKVARLPVGREIRRLKRVQELLGRLHDLQMLQLHVQAVAASPAAEVRLTRPLGRILAAFETECRMLHASFVSSRPSLIELAARVTADAAPLHHVPLEVRQRAPARMLEISSPAKRRRTLTA